MDELRELAYLVTRNKLKSVELLDPSNPSRLVEFYDKIARGELSTDAEALHHFFPGANNTSPYRKLKSNLKRRLINSLFLIDVKQPSYSNRQRAYFECHKEWAAAKMLLGKNAWTACIEICERIIKYAQQYEFTEMALDLARILRLNYSTRAVDFKKFEYYRDQHSQLEQLLLAENRAELLYCELLINYVNSRATKKELRDLTLAYSQEIEPLLNRFQSYRLHLYGFLIRLMVHTTVNDYTATLPVCEEIIAFFESKPYEAHTPLQAAYYQKLVCHLQLRQFEQGQAAAQRCISLIDEGTVNWFKYHELYFMLAMHTRRYQEAYGIFETVTGHKRFSFQSSASMEMWTIYEAYLHYLTDRGYVQSTGEKPLVSRFRVGRFVNETPIFSKDKRGMNIAILVAQILYLLLHRQYDQAIDRLEAIEKYCNRYLHKGETIRSYYFIKMLLTIPAAGFKRAEAARRGEPLREKLAQLPLEAVNQAHKIEIVPYEQLWDMALEALDGTQSYHSSYPAAL